MRAKVVAGPRMPSGVGGSAAPEAAQELLGPASNARRVVPEWRRKALGAACAASCLLPLTPAAAGSPTADVTAVFVAEPVKGGSSSVQVDLRFSWGRGGGFVGYVATSGKGRAARPTDGFGIDVLPADGPYASADGTVLGCGPTSPCSLETLTNSEGGVTLFQVAFSEQAPSAIYFVVKGRDFAASASPGWIVRRTTQRAHLVSADAGGATAGQVAANRVERFQAARFRTSARRSLAIGIPPCRNAHRVGFVREGSGTGTLSGGRTAASLDCADTGVGEPVAVADAPTTWALTGDVVGVATGPTRLAVIEV
jgi:hypothetical protein